LYANVRPALTLVPGGRYENIDLVTIRENTEGLYVGFEHYIPIDGDPHAVAIGSGVNTRAGCRRIAEFAFEYALQHGRRKVTIVHKANILKALTGLFRETANDVAKRYEGRVQSDERIVDACAMQLVLNPWQFDVIVTTNLFGDILSDEIAGLVGGLGMAPGANIGENVAIFEAVHGSAPDIAGKGIANPLALLLASAMMLFSRRLSRHRRPPARGYRHDAQSGWSSYTRPLVALLRHANSPTPSFAAFPEVGQTLEQRLLTSRW
jgi:isocitrate dehydrogenase (NAD+)